MLVSFQNFHGMFWFKVVCSTVGLRPFDNDFGLTVARGLETPCFVAENRAGLDRQSGYRLGFFGVVVYT